MTIPSNFYSSHTPPTLLNAGDFSNGIPGPDGKLTLDTSKLEQIQPFDRRWAWLEIDLGAIRHNTQEAHRALAPGTKLMAVVKADGYGHGAVRCAKTALNSGATWLGVSNVEEGAVLRSHGIKAPILLLAQPPQSAIPMLIGYDITPTIYTADFAVAYGEFAQSFGAVAKFHLKINTGMNRIGVRHDEVVEFIRQTNFHAALRLEGVFTHFASADVESFNETKKQYARFEDALRSMREAGVNPGIVHAANSAALFRFHDTHFDMVREGIALYGYQPADRTETIVNLRPAMSVKARITAVNQVPLGEGVSYGLYYKSPGSVKICTIPLGYADGLRRNLSGSFDLEYGGIRCRQVGNICMDQCMFEVNLRTYVNGAHLAPEIGDDVTVVGQGGKDNPGATIEDLASTLGSNAHEVAIGFAQRMHRIYINS